LREFRPRPGIRRALEVRIEKIGCLILPTREQITGT
jgi:hypothetical protein